MVAKEANSGTIPGIPMVKGLVLAGGRSSRMGRDKSCLHYHGKEQRYYVAELLRPFCSEVFISCRQEQLYSVEGYNVIPDIYPDQGPLGGLLSAFDTDETCAWLAVACDLPLLDAATLSLLLHSREPSCVATTFQSSHDGLPEPLLTIWEPKAYPVLRALFEKGHRCARKALLNSNINIIMPLSEAPLMNVNTPEEFETARQLLTNKKMDSANSYGF